MLHFENWTMISVFNRLPNFGKKHKILAFVCIRTRNVNVSDTKKQSSCVSILTKLAGNIENITMYTCINLDWKRSKVMVKKHSYTRIHISQGCLSIFDKILEYNYESHIFIKIYVKNAIKNALL